MFDYKPTLVTALNTILPSYYEGFSGQTSMPCITYQEVGDTSVAEGETLRYCRKRYRVKLWGDGLETLSPYALLVDAKMKELGFTRNNYNELWFNQDQLCLIIDYDGLGLE